MDHKIARDVVILGGYRGWMTAAALSRAVTARSTSPSWSSTKSAQSVLGNHISR